MPQSLRVTTVGQPSSVHPMTLKDKGLQVGNSHHCFKKIISRWVLFSLRCGLRPPATGSKQLCSLVHTLHCFLQFSNFERIMTQVSFPPQCPVPADFVKPAADSARKSETSKYEDTLRKKTQLTVTVLSARTWS